MSGPLDGVRVLDLTSVVLGPYATRLLGDYGADIVKVEPPEGDVMRHSGPMRNPGMGHLYLSANRSKRSIVLDLKKPAGRDALLRLARNADVLATNVRPKAMARLGLGWDEVSRANPRIIYASAVGFSQQGPYAARPAYDDLIQGMAGIPWLVQQAGAELPRYAPMILADRLVGVQFALAITAALHWRQKTGQGQRVDVPMYEGLLDAVLGEHLSGRAFVPDEGPAGYARSITPDRRPYRTKDGWICALVYTDRQWRAFLGAIGEPERFDSDPHFATHGARAKHVATVYGYLAGVIATRTTDDWLELFARADLPAARMQSVDDILADPHLAATGFVAEFEHPSEGRMRGPGVATQWSASQPAPSRHAPRLGEQTREILREAGYGDAEIDAMLADRSAAQA